MLTHDAPGLLLTRVTINEGWYKSAAFIFPWNHRVIAHPVGRSRSPGWLRDSDGDTDADELRSRHLCFECTGDEYFSDDIRKDGKPARCGFCGESRSCYSLNELADRVETAYEQHYVRTSDQPDAYQTMMLSDRESDYEWECGSGRTVYAVMNAAEISEEAAADLQTILDDRHSDFDSAAMGEETEFADEVHYKEKGVYHSEWASEWDSFENLHRTEARFFNQSAVAHLASLFDGVEALATRKGRSIIVKAGPRTRWKVLFRARVFQSDGELKAALARPDRHLGPPPPSVLARKYQLRLLLGFGVGGNCFGGTADQATAC